MKKIYKFKMVNKAMEHTTGELEADNRRDAKRQVEKLAEISNATEWYFELA